MAAQARPPLTGCRVLVTRARAQAGALVERLEQRGATVVELPAIEIVPADSGPIDAAIRDLPSYDWVVFTSSNGVDAFVDRLNVLGVEATSVNRARVAAIGRATASRLAESGVRVDVVPDRFIAESVVDALVDAGVDGRRVLLPQAEIARDVVATRLREAGAEVDVVVAYRTVVPEGVDVRQVQRALAEVDVVTFASPSSVRNTIALAGGSLPNGAVVCIGPVTADAAREAGVMVAAVAEEHSIKGLVESVVGLMTREQRGVPDVEQQ